MVRPILAMVEQPVRHVYVASTNNVKVAAVQNALAKCFPKAQLHVTGRKAESGVPDQPVGDDETLLGARNRIKSLKAQGLDGGLLVAIEGGIGTRTDGAMECFAWAVVERGATGAESTARSGSFVLPPALAELVHQGWELGAADDKVFGRQKSGQGSGTVGHLSKGILTRQLYYEHTMVMALLPLVNPELYGEQYRLF